MGRRRATRLLGELGVLHCWGGAGGVGQTLSCATLAALMSRVRLFVLVGY